MMRLAVRDETLALLGRTQVRVGRAEGPDAGETKRLDLCGSDDRPHACSVEAGMPR